MKQRFQWRHQYDADTEIAAEERTIVTSHDSEPSMTNQQHTKDVDLNVMVKRMGITDGSIPPAMMDPSLFGDFSDPVDIRDIFDRMRAAEEMFRELPAEIRNRFNHNAAALLDFVSNPKNHEEAVELGLLQKKAVAGPERGSKENPIFTAPLPATPPASQ